MANRRLDNRLFGRQGEQLMNEKVFNSFNRIKYIGNGLDAPKQEYQTPILDYSLWINRTTGSDVMQVYDQADKVWKPMFQGYYHPVNLKEQPLFPVDGQIFIDSNGVLRYYEDKQWKVVAAASADDSSAILMGLENFLIMPDMAPLSDTRKDYLVPSTAVGKMFDNKKLVTRDKYIQKDMRVTYPINGLKPEEILSWIHVNPAYLSGARKRLIKILPSMKSNNYFISTPTLNTEFYGFKNGETVGTLLRYLPDFGLEQPDNPAVALLENGYCPLLEDEGFVLLEEQPEEPYFGVTVNPEGERIDTISDYRVVSGGIQLINDGVNYDFIYAITYKFDTVEDHPGSLVVGSTTVKDSNQIFVGEVGGYPLVFLGGLYYDTGKYTYSNGIISFNNDEISFYYDPVTQTIYFTRAVETTIEVDDGDEDVLTVLLNLDNDNAPITETIDEVLESLETHNEIEQSMDLVVVAFADVIRDETDKYSGMERQQIPPYEFDIKPENVVEMEFDGVKEQVLRIQHKYLEQITRDDCKFKHPIAFVQGVGTIYDEEFGIKDEMIINSNEIIIRNFGPKDPNVKELKLLIADIGDARLSGGKVTTDKKIFDDRIKDGNRYLVFINGVCTSPSDHEVYDGYIEIDDLLKYTEDVAETEYFLMSLEEGDKGIDLLFDSTVSYFTFKIEDNVEGQTYNNCDMVVSYVVSDKEDEEDMNGVLIDRTAIQINDIGEESYSTGEILYLRDTDDEDVETYVYKIFNAKGNYQWDKYSEVFSFEDAQRLNLMATQTNTEGSVSIMNSRLKDKNIVYYAYSYADETDEPILKGSGSYKCAIKGHREDANIPDMQDFYVRRIHVYYPSNKGILSTYVNGLQVRSYDNETIECKYHIPTHENLSLVKTWGNECDLYNLIKAVTPDTNVEMLRQMKEGEFSEELKNFSITESLLERLIALRETILEIESNNRLDYFVEKLEQGEQYSADREWCNQSNRYTFFDNTYNSGTFFGPGNVDVYLNGVMLDRGSYSIFDSSRIILNDLNVAGGSDEYGIDPNGDKLIKYYVTKYNEEMGKTVGEVCRVYCESPDEVLVEYKTDTSIRKTSYEIKEVTYDTGVLSYDDYEFPNSLLNTKDEIKIWIDGILYTGGYSIKNKDIILKNSPLQLDPIRLYFDSHPDIYKEWKQQNGEYTYRKSRIIFEWR